MKNVSETLFAETNSPEIVRILASLGRGARGAILSRTDNASRQLPMIRLDIDARDAGRVLGWLHRQTRFAAALALTRTAQDAKAEIVAELPRRFTIRTGWLAKGIRIRPATKANLVATVLSLDHFMALQETGGAKTPRQGGRLGVPIGARPTPSAVTRPGIFPGALMRRGRSYVIDEGERVLMFRRAGHGRRSRSELMYVLRPSVAVEPRFGFRDTVTRVALDRFAVRLGETIGHIGLR